MKFKIVCGVAFLSLISLVVDAQTVSLGGEYRFNPVYSRGFRMPMYEGDKAGFYTMQRTRLILDYEKQDDLTAQLIIQDRRFWGDKSDRADDAEMNIFRAWVEKSFSPNLSLRIGRQGFIYDDQHLLGDPNWVGTRAHDAALVKWQSEGFKAHLALAYNANGQENKRMVYTYNMYKNMQFLWLEKKLGDHVLTFTAINRGMERGDMTSAYTQTFGPYAKIRLSDKVTLKGMYYHQVGETTDDLDVNAFFYSALITYKASKATELTIGVDAGSGTDQSVRENPDNTKSRTFDRHYGLLHGHFGYLDYFYVNEPTPYGVHDYYLKTKFNINTRLVIEDHIHKFESSSDINDPVIDGRALKRNLGIENDIVVSYKLSDTFKASIAHSILFGTETLDQAFGGQKSVENQVFYAVITASLDFFKWSKDNNPQ